MRVLGLDPGLATTGVAVVERASPRPKALMIGAVRTAAGVPTEKRLAALRARLAEILDEYRPEIAAVERLFFNVNVKTA
ncbi:MAG: crossover junction endodeoxyribonuclease RuvC, partial [Actinomycetota bacterium]|nr:crossover junction endodeoxyribonuclease RuvC [Actinomycetota bacterium]